MDRAIDIATGRALRSFRLRRKVSAREVAGQIGVSEQGYYAWENGRNVPRLGDLLRILRILRASPAELLAALGVNISQASATPFPDEYAMFADPVTGNVRANAHMLDRAILGDLNGDELTAVIGFANSLRASRPTTTRWNSSLAAAEGDESAA